VISCLNCESGITSGFDRLKSVKNSRQQSPRATTSIHGRRMGLVGASELLAQSVVAHLFVRQA
jgi:hypothetical protein